MTPEDAFNEKLRQIIERLDNIISLLNRVVSVPPDEILRSLLSVAVPAAPKTSTNIVVGITPTVLAENKSLSVMRVEITNDDIAQQIYLDCNQSLLVSQGRRLNAQQTIPYTLNKGMTLYGICIIATVNTRVAYSQSPASALKEGNISV